MLNKKFCFKCWFDYCQKNKWLNNGTIFNEGKLAKAIDTAFKQNYINCPSFIYLSRQLKTTDKPPNRCPFLLEHIISEQKMLNKKICQKCYKTSDALRDVYWTWQKQDEKNWKNGFIFCPTNSIRNFIPINKPPVNCPYILEHIVI